MSLRFGLVGVVSATGHDHRDVRVYFFGFDIQRITGIPEADIASSGCAYIADARRLTTLLALSPASSRAYESRDVRAKVIGLEGVDFYVDASGVAKVGARTVDIDKTAFSQLLELDRSVPCPQVR